MAIFRSVIKTLTRNSKSTRTFLTATTTTISSTPFPSPHLSLFLSPHLSFPHSRFSLSPLSKLFTPFSGPLFLSSPPWKLSQSATPLLLQADVVFLTKVKALTLLRTRSLPIKLGFAPISPGQEFLLNRVDVKDFNNSNDNSGSFAESFLNLPNLVSLSRLVSGPVLGWMIINEWYVPAFFGLAISGATDWLDGYMARKMNINSVIGSYLDPLADKVLIGCVALGMVHKDLLHPGLVGLVVLRDVVLVGGAVYKRASDLGWEWKSWHDFFNLDGTAPQKVEPLFISKVNTVLQLALVAAALLQPVYGTEEMQLYITYLSWLVASTTVASTVAYGAQQMGKKTLSITKRK